MEEVQWPPTEGRIYNQKLNHTSPVSYYDMVEIVVSCVFGFSLWACSSAVAAFIRCSV